MSGLPSHTLCKSKIKWKASEFVSTNTSRFRFPCELTSRPFLSGHATLLALPAALSHFPCPSINSHLYAGSSQPSLVWMSSGALCPIGTCTEPTSSTQQFPLLLIAHNQILWVFCGVINTDQTQLKEERVSLGSTETLQFVVKSEQELKN